MAIFLSRIKKVLNLGVKSITSNGTYNASSDGYDGYSQVTVNVSGGGGTPITPSNANPVALTSGNTVTPTAAGYAIESYSAVNPTIGGAINVSSGSIYKMGANGVVTGQIDNLISSANGTPITGLRVYKSINGGFAYSVRPTAKVATYNGSVGKNNSVRLPLTNFTGIVVAIIGCKWSSSYTMYSNDDHIESDEYRFYYFTNGVWSKSNDLRMTIDGSDAVIWNKSTSNAMTVDAMVYYM